MVSHWQIVEINYDFPRKMDHFHRQWALRFKGLTHLLKVRNQSCNSEEMCNDRPIRSLNRNPWLFSEYRTQTEELSADGEDVEYRTVLNPNGYQENNNFVK